jgi:HlyD family secretion protein
LPKRTAPDAVKPPKRKSQKRITRFIPYVIGAVLLGFLVMAMLPKPVHVETAQIDEGAVTLSVTEEGRTRIRNRYIVAAPATGQMRRVDLRAGDRIEAQQTILTVIESAPSPLLDPRALAGAMARVKSAEAAKLRAEQNLGMTRSALSLAEREWERTQQLFERGGSSVQERDRVLNQLEVKRREVRAGEFELQVANFDLEQARAALKRINDPERDEPIEVRAPVSGVVLRVMQESSTPITAGTPILEVGDPRDLEIEAEILSRDAVQIQAGTAMWIEQWGGAAPLQARVRRVEPAGFTKISALGVEEQRVLVIGDFVEPPPPSVGDRYRIEARIALQHTDRAVRVPTGALFRQSRNWQVFVVENGKAKRRSIEIGVTGGDYAVVQSGLRAGEKVILHPPDTLNDGSAVESR